MNSTPAGSRSGRRDRQLLLQCLHAGDGVLGVARLQAQLHPRVCGPKAVQQVNQDAVAGGDRAVEADLAAKLVGWVGELEANLVPLLHRISGVALELVPAAVSSTVRLSRSNNATPSSSSSCRMCRDIAEVLMFERALARPKCKVSLSSTKCRSTVMFMLCPSTSIY